MKIFLRDRKVHDPEDWIPRDHGLYHLHMGMSLPDAILLIAFMDQEYGDHIPVWVDGDGWNQWSVDPGTGVNDASTLHVVIPRHTVRDAQRLVADMLDLGLGHERFVPIANQQGWPENHVPVIAMVTDGFDHSNKVHHLSWQGEDGARPHGVDFSMWPKGRKAYHIEISDEDTAAFEDWMFSTSAQIVEVVDAESGTPAVRS